MNKQRRGLALQFLIALSLISPLIPSPALAQETDKSPSEDVSTPAEDPATLDSSDSQTESNSDSDENTTEDPELPDEMLVLPEDDPNFVPDPNQQPLEEDFLRMPLARNPLYWRLELRERFGGTNNVDQVANSPASWLNNQATLTGLLRYTFPTQTQLLLRSQAFLFNYFDVAQRDQALAIPLSLTATQWFSNQANVYGGYIPILSTSLNRADGNLQRFDQDGFLGASYYYPLGKDYLFGGYQLDYMAADLAPYSYLGNLFFAGYRHSFNDDLFLFLDARIQPRGYITGANLMDELRLGGGVALQWQIFRPWLILEARGNYNQIVNFTSAERNAGIFSLGVNLIAALQSES